MDPVCAPWNVSGSRLRPGLKTGVQLRDLESFIDDRCPPCRGRSSSGWSKTGSGELIKPLLPPRSVPKGPGGRPRVDDRTALEGILFVLHTVHRCFATSFRVGAGINSPGWGIKSEFAEQFAVGPERGTYSLGGTQAAGSGNRFLAGARAGTAVVALQQVRGHHTLSAHAATARRAETPRKALR